MAKDLKSQVEGKPVSSGTATPKLRKASVSPTPSDKGNYGRGKG
jgi:hypothetical protein